tara:strand:+ start:266 stop:643 length:378 start_codon:yes stop_codon:yes gene_type:complete
MVIAPMVIAGEGLVLEGGSIKSFSEGDINDLVKQNIKMILLTCPGERMMITNFGVGLRNYLFRMPTPSLYNEIKSRAKSQLSQYSPPISIKNMEISFQEETLYFKLDYIVNLTKVHDSIEVEVTA